MAALVLAETLFRLGYPLVLPENSRALRQWIDGPHLPPAAHFAAHPDYFYAYDSQEAGVNELGFLGPLPAKPGATDAARIVVLGDSTVAGEHSWAMRLPQAARQRWGRDIQVAQAAVPGWSLREVAMAVETLVPRYEPDAVIVHAGVNDLGAAMVAGFRPDYGHWRQPTFGQKRSAYRLIKRRRQLFGVSRLAAWLARATGQPMPTPPRLDALANRPEGQPIDGNFGPEFAAAIAAHLERIAAVCERHGVACVWTTQPICATHGVALDPSQTVQRGMAMVTKVIRAAQAAAFVDMAAALDERCALFTDIVHTNPAGDAAKADLAVEALPGALEWSD